jgi:replication-associated recombination protein RarA
MNLWTETYRPKSCQDVVGHTTIVQSCKEFLAKWKEEGPRPEAVFLWGPPGTGKTTIIHSICMDVGFDCIEYNASDLRTISMIKKVRANSKSKYSIESFFSSAENQKPRPVAILFDEIDGISAGESLQEVINWIQESGRVVPLFFTANQPIISLRNHCLSHFVMSPAVSLVVDTLRQIADKEGLTISNKELEQIARTAKCDIRQSAVMLQFGNRTPCPEKKRPLDMLLSEPHNTENSHILFSLMLHPSCPLEVLKEWRYLNPCPANIAEATDLEKVLRHLRDKPFSEHKTSNFSALS